MPPSKKARHISKETETGHFLPIRDIPASGYLNEQRTYRFKNGYGASVVRGPFTYGGTAGLFELAVVSFIGPRDNDWVIDYDTPITEDVIGYLAEEEVQKLLREINDLPSKEEA